MKQRSSTPVAPATTTPKPKTGKTPPPHPESPTASAATTPETTGPPNLLDLLMQDVNWDVVKQVMQYEIPLPFSTRTADLADEEIGKAYMSKEEQDEIVRNKNLVGDKIGEILVQRGEISREEFDRALKLRERTRQPIWRTLLQLQIVTPAQVARVYRTVLPTGPLPDSKFTQWLIEHKHCTRAKLSEAWEAAKAERIQFHDHLRAEGIVPDDAIAEALASQTKVPYEDLKDLDSVPADVIRRLPLSIPLKYTALPYRFSRGKLDIAFSTYEDILDFGQLGLMLDFEVRPVIVPRQRLAQLLKRFAEDFDEELRQAGLSHADLLKDEIELLPSENVLDRIFSEIIRRDGTDVHIEPQRGFYRIRFRMDGLLHDMISLAQTPGRRLVNQIKALAQMDPGNTLVPQDGHLLTHLDGENWNFRVSTIPVRGGEKVVLRLVRQHFAFSRLDQLGMSLKERQSMDEILNAPSGLILASGPVGSGKTTTLYSCLNCMNLFSRNIMTIEDPIEYELPGASQSQVNPKAHFTFATGLRSILRQDPDIIMVGEIRDEETAKIAVRASLAGQKVLSTVHANSATNACASIVMAGVRPTLVAHAITGVVFQRLVRKVCPKCSQKHMADAKLKRELGINARRKLVCRIGKGCPHCLYTGVKGRTGVFEILRVSRAFRNVIAQNPTPGQLDEAAMESGLLPLRDHTIHLLEEGVIPPAEALEVL